MRFLMKTMALFMLLSIPIQAGTVMEERAAPNYFPDGWGSFWEEALRSVDAVGFILVALLAVLLGMCLDMFYHLRIGKFIPEALLADVQEEMTSGEYEKALELCEKSNSPIGQIFAAALSKTDYSFERMAEAMRNEVRIQCLLWRQWTGQFRLMALAGFLAGFLGAMFEAMRFVADLRGRPDLGLALASSFETRSIAYSFFFALLMGAFLALASLIAFSAASSKLEKILLEGERLGEELLDPFRPLPALQEE